MGSPYSDLPARSFWKSGVVAQDWSAATGLYRKKFAISPKTRIVTAGSCFAQNIARHLRARGYRVVDAERAPPGLSGEAAKKFGYELYSARYGNIYTMRQLLQLLREALGRSKPEHIVWEKDGRYFDALRPSVEPDGLDSPADVAAHRKDHLARVRAAFGQADLFVFTLGLTEGWEHTDGTVYPTAPGTIAGSFDSATCKFKNFGFKEIHSDFLVFRKAMKNLNPDVKFLLTVSPVPLTATASDMHVLPATIYSKSVLRAVAGALAQEFDDVDYFPSYEIISTPFLGKVFYDANLRSVSAEGIDTVMRIFFSEHGGEAAASENAPAAPRARTSAKSPAKAPPDDDDELVCEELLLEAFAPS